VPPAESAFEGLRAAYLERLREAIETPVEYPTRVLGGVAPLLTALERDPRVAVGLLTGNFEGGAAIKLGHFDLWRRFPFGAFGDRHVDRRDLVPIALERAAEAGAKSLPPDRVVVIGDTPLDIDCASAHGARSIGVATGPYDREALTRAGAALAVETLEDVEALVDWIVGATR
jgi:phosphoglycolate phosphatase-like HAD superfamily hydrolase